MKLRSLRVHGFKSFADPTVIEFHEGITAIVGPNGCGKSNLSDAIRWVLGEQRPSAIRGGKMEEAIFQGSVNRRPVNRGTVTIVVSNEDGLLPVAFEEVEIGRTVYRDGGSHYSLNRSTCRLRDVIDLCRDTGLGANAYSIIENRMIDAILSDRAEERRHLFEEASGIGKYKDRRKAALRRLEHAENDLTRLEDVIGEIETKVRSLSRQKGKAERYKMLRERRLAVEVAVVRTDLADLRTRLTGLDKALTGDRELGEGMAAELQSAEAVYETLRLEEVTAEKARTGAGAVLEGVRNQLVEWERDLAVAEERRAYAERRLGLIGVEREGSSTRVQEMEKELAGLEEAREGHMGDLESLRAARDRQTKVVEEVRSRLDEARERVERSAGLERDLVRKGAQLEGDAEAARGQAAELERRLQRISSELEDAATVLSDLASQGDLFATRQDGFKSDVEGTRGDLADTQQDRTGAKESLERVRGTYMEAVRAVQEIEAELTVLDAMERRGEGSDPVAEAARAGHESDVLGTILDFVEAPPDLALAVESYLGILSQALVVRDGAAVDRLVRWFNDEWEGGGGLILLPLDQAPRAGSGSLLGSVRATGEGAPWVEALLGGVDLVDEPTYGAPPSDRARLARDGTVVERGGLVRVGTPSGASGLLERRERIGSLRSALEETGAHARAAAQDLERAESAVHGADVALEKARAAFFSAEDELREASAEAAAQVDRRARVDRHSDELARQSEGAKAARARALERMEIAKEDRAGLLAEEESIRKEREAGREALAGVQDEWDEVRAEESRLSVQLVRMEAEAERVKERLESLTRDRGAAELRLGELDDEEKVLTEGMASAQRLQEEGGVATEGLFLERDAAQGSLEEKSQVLSNVAEALREAEKKVRVSRSAEREAVDRKHQLELERQEVAGRIGLIQERLEGEWGRPLERLLEEAEAVEGDHDELKAELEGIVVKLERIGLVNMLAVEEHAEESARLTFLTEQRDDLIEARDDLRSAIRKINETAISLFEGTFESIRENFRATFHKLFEGGEADIWLADPDDPLESPIEIHASPKGKKTQRIDLLSGGERALTALSLLFGIYLVKPSPFCVLDEVDAPLDESNIGRFIHLLEEFKAKTQFVVITHNPRTIAAADWIYGVTMEEPGVSTIVGVKLGDAAEEVGGSAA